MPRRCRSCRFARLFAPVRIDSKQEIEVLAHTRASAPLPCSSDGLGMVSPLGHCHLGPRLSCRHVRLGALFRRAVSVCVISIVAIAPSLRIGGAACRTHTHARTQWKGGGVGGTHTLTVPDKRARTKVFEGVPTIPPAADLNVFFSSFFTPTTQEHFWRHLAFGAG